MATSNNRDRERGKERNQEYGRQKKEIIQKFQVIPRFYATQLKGSRFNINRQPLDPIPVRGVMEQWEESGFGFIEPSVDLSRIEGFSGKVFVHKNDLKFGVKSLQKGDQVSFLLYRDSKGIGAHACCLIKDEDRDENHNIVPLISLVVPNRLLPRLIGRGGESINQLTEECEVEITIHSDSRRNRDTDLQLITVTGDFKNLTRAVDGICQKLALPESSAKMIFIIPEDQVGRFVGIGGAHIRSLTKQFHGDVSISLSNYPVKYQNSDFNKVTLFGPQPLVRKALEVVVDALAELYLTIVDDYLTGRKRTIKPLRRENNNNRDDHRESQQGRRSYEDREKNNSNANFSSNNSRRSGGYNNRGQDRDNNRRPIRRPEYPAENEDQSPKYHKRTESARRSGGNDERSDRHISRVRPRYNRNRRSRN